MCVRILGVFFIFPNYFLFYSFSPPCGARDGTQSKMLARQVLHHSPIPTALALLIYHHLIFSPSFGSTAVTKTYYKRATSANGTDCVNSTLHTKVCHKMLILEKTGFIRTRGVFASAGLLPVWLASLSFYPFLTHHLKIEFHPVFYRRQNRLAWKEKHPCRD